MHTIVLYKTAENIKLTEAGWMETTLACLESVHHLLYLDTLLFHVLPLSSFNPLTNSVDKAAPFSVVWMKWKAFDFFKSIMN